MQIMQITKQSEPIEKAKVATVTYEVNASSRTYSKIYNEINQTLALAENDVEKLVKLASKKGFVFRSSGNIAATNKNVANLADSRKMVQWAFSNEINDISEIYDCGDCFAVAYISEISDDDYMPLANVSAALKSEIVKDKKAAVLIAKYSKQNLSSVQMAAKAFDSKVDTAKYITFNSRHIAGVGNEPLLIGAANVTPKGQITKPLQGSQGIYVYKVFDKKIGKKSNVKLEKTTINRTLTSRIGYSLSSILRSKADIEDNRVRFF